MSGLHRPTVELFNQPVVTGERKKEQEYAEADYYRVERFYGTVERHSPLPKTIHEKAIKATYQEGVLEIVLKGAVLVAAATKQQAKAIPVEVKTPEAGGERVAVSGPVASSAGASGPFPSRSLRVSVRPMAASLPATTALEPEDDAVLDEPLDLRALAEASTSSGSYCLRWQLFVSANRSNAVV